MQCRLRLLSSCTHYTHDAPPDLAKRAAHSVASGFYVPESRSNQRDPPEISHVSTKLDDITLNDTLPQAAAASPPPAPLSPIQDTEQKQSSVRKQYIHNVLWDIHWIT